MRSSRVLAASVACLLLLATEAVAQQPQFAVGITARRGLFGALRLRAQVVPTCAVMVPQTNQCCNCDQNGGGGGLPIDIEPSNIVAKLIELRTEQQLNTHTINQNQMRIMALEAMRMQQLQPQTALYLPQRYQPVRYR